MDRSIPQTDPEPSRIHTTSKRVTKHATPVNLHSYFLGLVDSRFNTINYVYGDQINHTFVHEDKGQRGLSLI